MPTTVPPPPSTVPPTTVAPPPPAPPGITDPRALLAAFFDAWRRGDAATMASLGEPSVVEGFRSEFDPSGFSGYSIVWDDAYCAVGSSGSGGCEVLLEPDDGYALIVQTGYHEVDASGRLQLDRLEFGGDAG